MILSSLQMYELLALSLRLISTSRFLVRCHNRQLLTATPSSCLNSGRFENSPLGLCVLTFPRMHENFFQCCELKTMWTDVRICQLFSVHPYYTFVFTRSVQLSPLPPNPTHHQMTALLLSLPECPTYGHKSDDTTTSLN